MLPPYYIIKNCILVACALDDWNDADYYRSAAEQAYDTTLAEATRKNDKGSLAALKQLRKELDQLTEFRVEDITGMTKEERMGTIDDDGDLYGMKAAIAAWEAEEEALAAEDEDEVSADNISPLVRPASEPTTPVPTIVLPTDSDQPPIAIAAPHRPKSVKLSKNGAYHAQ